MEEFKSRGFLLKQRAFLKLYIYRIIDHNKGYASQYLNDLRNEFKEFGYKPSHTELYKVLHDLTRDGHVKREKQLLRQEEAYFQEIVLYQLTEKGKKEYELYKKQMKVELERCKGLLDKALKDNYGA